jgi:hypothetical protein
MAVPEPIFALRRRSTDAHRAARADQSGEDVTRL